MEDSKWHRTTKGRHGRPQAGRRAARSVHTRASGEVLPASRTGSPEFGCNDGCESCRRHAYGGGRHSAVKLGDLTARQREAIEAREPVVLVLGGPGTGKTTVALWAARVALTRESVSAWQRVLFLTFSRTAVAQIAKRSPGVF